VKIEQLIVQHLYNSKTVTLQGIGTIQLDPSVRLPAEGDKDTSMPEHAFSFDYNLKAGEDEELINFIVQQTRKIKPLATSDLESYSILAKQFLNIGKPLTIDGVGTIIKSQEGTYEFKQGSFITPKIDDIAREIKEKNEDNISFESEAPKTGNSKKLLVAAVIIVFAALAGLGLYYFITKQQPAPVETVEQLTPLAPVKQDTAKADTAQIIVKPDSIVATAPVTAIDTNSFKVAVKQYSNEAAINKDFSRFTAWGYKLEIIKHDTANYELVAVYKRRLSDTAKTKDSLKVVFQGRPYIILNKQ
jgi:hypothetical protein